MLSNSGYGSFGQSAISAQNVAGLSKLLCGVS